MNRIKITKMLQKLGIIVLVTIQISTQIAMGFGSVGFQQKHPQLPPKSIITCMETINSQMIVGKVTGTHAPHQWYIDRLDAMARAYNKPITIVSGYRSNAEQQVLWNASDKSGKMVAQPGCSRHNCGLAVDVSGWATQLNNAELSKFGLYKPMCYENWHIEPLETQGKSTMQLLQQYGTPSNSFSIPTVTDASKNLGDFKITAYDLSVKSCGKTRDNKAFGITHSGYDLKDKSRISAMTVAVDTKVIPLGTKLYLQFKGNYSKYNGIYTARDTGGAIKENRIDLYFGDFNSEQPHQSCYDFGITNATVYVL